MDNTNPAIFPAPARSAEPVTFWPQLKQAVADGVLLGVKYGLAAVLVLLAVSYLLTDYAVLRQRGLHGQQAYEFLIKASPPAPGAK